MIPVRSAFNILNHRPPALPLFLIRYSSSSTNNLLRSAMETYSKDNKEAKKDEQQQQREACDNGACDISSNQSNKVADDILPHILNLYASRASPQDFEIYAPDASFEDPLMCARGVKQIKSAFYSLSKVFSESKIVEYTLQENILPHGTREILIDNKQYYKFMGKNIDMISLIKLYVENGKVIRHEDCWDKKPLWNKETSKVPLVGKLVEMAKRGSMFATHAMMRFGKDPTT
ncbi:putative NTF2-like domain superfamily protein [Helianthus debilis subsp. tardiflorus]